MQLEKSQLPLLFHERARLRFHGGTLVYAVLAFGLGTAGLFHASLLVDATARAAQRAGVCGGTAASFLTSF